MSRARKICRFFRSGTLVNGSTASWRNLNPALKMTSKRFKHSFAPLGPSTTSKDDAIQLQGIVFDMDGTLCEPQNWMFTEMRAALAIPKSVDILDYIHGLPAPQQTEAFDKIKAIERKGMEKQMPQAGLARLMEYLDRRGMNKGICTRNFDAPVTHLLKTHLPAHIHPFHPIVTREFRPPKPDPAGILHIAEAWGVGKDSSGVLPVVMVGDSIDDMISGRDAGALTVLLRSEGKRDLENDERTDVAIGALAELIDLLEEGLSPRK